MKNNYPIRSEQHEIDSRGSSLLSYVLPENFIFRIIGERDYGIDGLIEFTPGGNVMGKMISMQLKSTKAVEWTKNGTTTISVRKATCNYWMQNTLPFLLFLADVSGNKVYYIDVKSQIRQKYSEFVRGDNFSFVLNKRYALQNTAELNSIKFNPVDKDKYLNIRVPFMFVIFTIIGYDSFLQSLMDFALNWRRYFEHIRHQDADPFLTQELEFYNTTQHINTLMLHISNSLKLPHNKVDLQKIREDVFPAYEAWRAMPESEILEYEITVIHSHMEQNMPAIISGIKNYILNLEHDYWKSCFPHIYQEAVNMDWEDYDW